MSLGVLSYVITAQTKPMQQSLQGAQNSIKSADTSMKKSAKNISTESKKMSSDVTGAVMPMEQGITAINPAAGTAVSGMKRMGTAAKALQVAMGPIGIAIAAIGLAVAALTSYFKGSVEGQQKFAKIMAYIGGLADYVKDLFIDLGGWIIKAFEDPQQSIKDLWEVIKKNMINRFEGMVKMHYAAWKVISEGARGAALAVAGIFDKDKREQAKIAFKEMKEGMVEFTEASLQAATGVENIIEKGREMGEEAMQRANDMVALQERENQLWEQQLKSKVDLAKLDGDIAEARRIANDDGEDAITQAHAMNAAMDMVNEKYQTQRQLLEEELAIQEERMALGHDDKDAVEERNKLQVDLINLKQAEENMTRSLLRRQTTINNRLEAEKKARNEIFEEMKRSQLDQTQRAISDLETALQEQLEAHEYTEKEKRDITEYYQSQINDVRRQGTDELLAEIKKEQNNMRMAAMSEIEILQETLDEKLAKHELSEAEKLKITEHYQSLMDVVNQEAADKEREQIDGVLNRIRENSMTKEELMREEMQRELEMEGLKQEELYEIRKYWEDKIREETDETHMAMTEAWENFKDVAGAALHDVGAEIGNIMRDGEADFRSLAMSALNSISEIVKGLLGQAIAGMIAGEASKGLLGIATAAVGIGAIKGMFSSDVPKMATGGVVPPGYPNDTYPALLSSGETVTPPRKLKDSSSDITVHGSLKGEDLMISNERANNKRGIIE